MFLSRRCSVGPPGSCRCARLPRRAASCMGHGRLVSHKTQLAQTNSITITSPCRARPAPCTAACPRGAHLLARSSIWLMSDGITRRLMSREVFIPATLSRPARPSSRSPGGARPTTHRTEQARKPTAARALLGVDARLARRVGDRCGREAGAEVAATNQFNSPPKAGMEFWIVPVTATYTGNKTGNPTFGITVKFVGSDNRTYDGHCGVIPDPLTDVGDLYNGGVAKGNTCVAVPAGASGLWTVSTGFASTPVFFVAK